MGMTKEPYAIVLTFFILLKLHFCYNTIRIEADNINGLCSAIGVGYEFV